MRRPRKTLAQRRQEQEAARARAWEEFLPKLEAAQTLADAMMLHSEAPGVDSPGRRFYFNLGLFLQTFARPDGANATEVAQYLRLIRNAEAEGAIDSTTRQKIEEDFKHVSPDYED